MTIFNKQIEDFFKNFGDSKKMVLSTSLHNQVSSRMMSIIKIKNKFYFQTDSTFRKYNQLIQNQWVALCIDNIQIEGVCKEVGKPCSHDEFMHKFKEHFENSYHAYSHLENERLFEVTPTRIECWIYDNGIPYMEVFDIERCEYGLHKYQGK